MLDMGGTASKLFPIQFCRANVFMRAEFNTGVKYRTVSSVHKE